MTNTHVQDTLSTLHGLPTPLLNEEGGSDAYPNDESEVGP